MSELKLNGITYPSAQAAFEASNDISWLLTILDKIGWPGSSCADYWKICQAAWAEYNKIQQAAWAEYNKINQAAWAEYEKICVTWIKDNIQVKGNEAYYIPEQGELILSGLDLAAKGNNVDHPTHYNTIPGIECIDVVQHMNFNRGNAVKYIWRAGLKGDVVEDLEKAIWYLQREISLLRSK